MICRHSTEYGSDWILENADAQLSPRIRALLATMWEEWKQVDRQVESFNEQIEAIGGEDPVCQRLREIPGVGPLIASAVVASIGNGAAFHKGRDFAAWLGLVPKQFSTGGKAKLLGISKRGNRYLRTMFIHGARSLVLRVNRERSSLGSWISSLEARAHRNVVIVAMAHKLARITWAVLSSGERYRPASVAA